MKLIKPFSALVFTLSASAFALPVTVQSTWEAWGLGGSSNWGVGVLTFTYDDQTPDTKPGDPTQGRYDNPLLSLTFDFDEISFTLDTSEPNHIGINALDPCGACTDMALTAVLQGSDNNQYELGLSLDWGASVARDAIESLLGKIALENASFLGIENGPQAALLQRSRFAEVPEPSLLALFSLGFAGLVGARMRSKFQR